ncbi:RNA cap guanine-N2 methyltransferase-domain-containing protein [Pseudoneurospora amorphoporcata]|uniref:Trimethylguanosine synthase n=1 Tax=Pseudoneurospora amorphoporcata TaxID=241081 RepID=A0AAN6SC43_9PEZI|nr:RNA cap guanine-N2 methyltransferase-domain-containing protein [Pseudoneurospora amorphoporcata]
MGSKLLKKGEKYALDENCHHYTKLSEVPWDIQKYWHQRFSIFEFYDYDIHLTDSAWFGVTPEPVATRIARDLSVHPIATGKRVLIDLFGGAGGNVIAFALSSGRWDRIIAIEKDKSTLACAQHNAEVYDVLDKIEWVHGDSFEVMRRFWGVHGGEEGRAGRRGDGQQSEEDDELDTLLASLNLEECLVFASPPWGGVSYRDQEVFDLSKMEPYNLEHLYEACSSPSSSSSSSQGEMQKRILPQALFLPRQSDLNQIAALVPDGAPKIDVVQYCQKGASKALMAYLPGNIDAEKEEERRRPAAVAKKQKSEEEKERGQKNLNRNLDEQEDEQERIVPELLTEATEVAQEEVSMVQDASIHDTSYAQDTSYLEAENTPNKTDNNAEKRKRKRRRRSSHNN